MTENAQTAVPNGTKLRSTIRFWIATALTILIVVAVWKFIDYRMQPPLPPNPVAPAAP